MLKTSESRAASFVVLLPSCRRDVNFVVQNYPIRRRLHKLVSGRSTSLSVNFCLRDDTKMATRKQVESLLFCIYACSLEYSSLSTQAGLRYHICGKLELAFKASPSSQHCTDEAQEAETVLQLVISISISISIYIYIYLYNNPSYSRILIGSRLWSIRGQTHR